MGKEQQPTGDHSEVKEFLKKWGKALGILALGLLGLAFIL